MKWVIQSDRSGSKLVDFLASQLRSSKKKIKDYIDHNRCFVNGRIERFASTLLNECDCVVLDLQIPLLAVSTEIESSRILYEDENFLAYNKPAGIVCDERGILSLWPLKDYKLVHRLDKETTGVLLIAKKESVFRSFVEQFKKHLIEKSYIAVVDGNVKESQGVIENYLGKKASLNGQTCWGSVGNSKGCYAFTAWECIKRSKDFSIIRCYPKTGRTHQIRIHMAEMGHPLLGDGQYGKKFISLLKVLRILLHAESLYFHHPINGNLMRIKAPIPADFPSME